MAATVPPPYERQMMNMTKKAVIGLMTWVSLMALIASAETENPEALIKRTLEVRPDVKVIAVEPSEISGLYAVQIQNGPTIYASADGKYFVHGELFAVQDKNFVNLTEQRGNGDRAKAMAAVKTEDMIVFKPKGPTRAVINVFTDVDCGYCQKFHKEVPELNAKGIEVRYLAFPRAGIGSESYQKLVTAWCAKDRQGTLTRYKNREAVPINTCAKNPVAAEYELGEQVGVNGTPTLVTAKGELITGYMPAQELADRMGLH
ncbi:MAG TPA: DsbC family protein [Spongiibacteraceae bacterium]